MLVPNNVQNTKLFQYAGAARFAYNWALAKEEENYKNGNKFISDSELRKEFTKLRNSEEYKWLLNISNNVTKQAIKDACNAYKYFFKGSSRHPRFKSKKKSKPKFYQDNVAIQFTDTHVKIEKLSLSKKPNKRKMNWVKLAECNRIPTNAKYMNPRISFDGLHWWISVCVDISTCDNNLDKNEGIGIDLGIKNLAICSDNNIYKNINKKPLKINELNPLYLRKSQAEIQKESSKK